MKFSPCVDMILADLPFEARLSKIKNLGFKAFEFWTWWDKDLPMVRSAAEKNGLKVAACCTKFISLVDPAQREAYLQGLRESIDAAKSIGCSTLISQVGNERKGVSRQEQKSSLVEGLKAAAPLLANSGMTLVFEPLNLLVDHAGYYLARSDEAFEVWKEVNSPQVKMLFDIYHQQITEGNLIPNIQKYYPSIGHFHIADHPGRHEPGTGEINYVNVLKKIESLGYQGYVGLEFAPVANAEEALKATLKLVA